MRLAAIAALVLVGVVPVQAQVRAAARASRARVKVLTVDAHAKHLRLDVSVRDPAAYLKHRYARVVEAVYRVAGTYRFIYLRVFDSRSGRAVFSFSDAMDVTSWHVVWKYVACARDLPLDWELDPDHAAPPCPAR